jgi:hypothetical protein
MTAGRNATVRRCSVETLVYHSLLVDCETRLIERALLAVSYAHTLRCVLDENNGFGARFLFGAVAMKKNHTERQFTCRGSL